MRKKCREKLLCRAVKHPQGGVCPSASCQQISRNSKHETRNSKFRTRNSSHCLKGHPTPRHSWFCSHCRQLSGASAFRATGRYCPEIWAAWRRASQLSCWQQRAPVKFADACRAARVICLIACRTWGFTGFAFQQQAKGCPTPRPRRRRRPDQHRRPRPWIFPGATHPGASPASPARLSCGRRPE